jgi:hypothetical protein
VIGHFQIDGPQYGRVGSQTHFNGARPLVKLRAEPRFDPLDPRVDLIQAFADPLLVFVTRG